MTLSRIIMRRSLHFIPVKGSVRQRLTWNLNLGGVFYTRTGPCSANTATTTQPSCGLLRDLRSDMESFMATEELLYKKIESYLCA